MESTSNRSNVDRVVRAGLLRRQRLGSGVHFRSIGGAGFYCLIVDPDPEMRVLIGDHPHALESYHEVDKAAARG